jgi:hypothetical protein
MFISSSTAQTLWFENKLGQGKYTVRLSYPSGVTGNMALVASHKPTDSYKTGAVEDASGAITFASGGARASRYIDVTGNKYIGVVFTSIAGGAAEAEVLGPSTD